MKLFLAITLVLSGAFAADLNTLPPPHQPPPPHHPQPPHQPPYPPQHPGWPDYGQGYTRRWVEVGTFKAPKVIKQDVSINTKGALVNELLLRVDNAPVDISSALVYMRNGQIIDLRQLNGSISAGREMRVRLDRYYSVRTSKIVLRIVSPQVVGPSSKIQVILGIAE